MVPPLIITLKIDTASQDFFSEQRKLYFPAHVNFLDAHLTLFHKLPADDILINETIELLCKRKSFSMEVTGVKNIGKGVVYTIHSSELQELHKQMQLAFSNILIPQDKGKLAPHITVQNKVTANKANVLHQNLSQSFKPFCIQATGIVTWLYLKGPWEKKAEFLFVGEE